MKEVKKRIIYLFYLLSQKDDFIRAKDLAKRTEVTERTIKNDVKELSVYAKKSGAELVSKRGAGYRLLVKDKRRFDYVKGQLHMHYSEMGNNQSEIKDRCNEIIRRIIVEPNYMTIDELAEDLFITKSAIRKELKLVNGYLKQFRLRWKKKNEEGPLIIGSEFNRRMLMLCVFENHYHEAVRMYEDDDFIYWFNYDEKDRYEIRHIFLKNLRESECHIRDEHTQRFARYLCLIANRVKAGNFVEFSDEQKDYIYRLKQSQVSKQIMKELIEYPGFNQLPEDEVLGFGLLLAEYADISPDCDIEKNYKTQLKEAESFLSEYKKVIKREYGIDLNDLPNSKNILIRGLIPLLIQKDFKLIEQETRITSIPDARVSDCLLATQMAFDALFLFKNKYGVIMTLDNVLTFSTSIHSLLLSIGYEFKPVRALIFSWSGLQHGTIISKMISKRYREAFEKIDVFELYEMRGLKYEDYDFSIMVLAIHNNLQHFAYKYDWPYMTMDTIPTQKQMNELYNRFILNGVQLNKAFNKLNLDRINIYRDVDVESKDMFIKLISYKLGKDSKSVKNIQKSLHYRSPVCVSNHVCVLFVKHSLVEKSILDIYQLKNKINFDEKPVSYIVVMSFNFNGSLESARFISDAIYMFFNDIKSLERIIESENKDDLICVVKKSLKVLPISLD